jgi:2-haloacid dehalogenase
MSEKSLIEREPRTIDTVVFDIGGVLIDWNPRYLYRRLFNDDVAMETFLAEVCNAEWNERQDAGRGWSEAISSLCEKFPKQASLIHAYRNRWDEMLGGPLHETVTILDELRAANTRLYALTNWSSDTFDIALQRYGFLQWFKDILVSGREELIKPDAAIFRLLLTRSDIDPARAVYIDDTRRHVDAAKALGMHGLLFRDASTLRDDLASLGLLAEPTGALQ